MKVTDNDIRCTCNRLLARRTQEGIELKCPRCRQIVLLRPEDINTEESELVLSATASQ